VVKKMLGRRRRRESAVPGRAAAVPIEVLYRYCALWENPVRVPEQKDNWASKSYSFGILSRLIIVHVKGYRFEDLIRV